MNVTLKTRTDYDLEHLEELQRVAGKTFARKETARKRGFALVTGGLCMATGLALAIKRGSVLLALICCILGALLLAWGIFFYTVTAWTSSRAMGKNWKGNEFCFERTEILATRGTDSSRFPYTDCAELLETEKNLYFMMKNGQGLMLDKENVRGGSVDDLRAWLMEKSGKEITWVGKKRNKTR